MQGPFAVVLCKETHAHLILPMAVLGPVPTTTARALPAVITVPYQQHRCRLHSQTAVQEPCHKMSDLLFPPSSFTVSMLSNMFCALLSTNNPMSTCIPNYI